MFIITPRDPPQGDPLLYAEDFVETLTEIDKLVFGPLNRGLLPRRMNELHPEGGDGYYLSRKLVSYGQYPQVVQMGTFALVRPPQEEYRVWMSDISHLAEKVLLQTRSTISDADFKRVLDVYAIAVVRRRVLENPELFPRAGLRCMDQFIQHERISAKHKEALMRERARLSAQTECTLHEADLQIVLLLIEIEMQSGKTLFESLHFLTT